MNLTTLRSKAKNNSLEVEHILKAAKLRLPALKETLMQLSVLHDWSYETYLTDGTHVVPLGKWAQVAGEYAEGGYPALAILAKNSDLASFIIAQLEEIHSQESLNALIDFYKVNLEDPSLNSAISWHILFAINSLLSFKNALPINDVDASLLSKFLIQFYLLTTTSYSFEAIPVKDIKISTIKANIVCAFRGVGDESVLEFLVTIDDFEYPYSGLKKLAINAIKKRIKN
jgi:hypothetical protein